MYKELKRTFEQAARGHGRIVNRNLIIAALAPAYLLARLTEIAFNYFTHSEIEKSNAMLRHGGSYAIKGGTAGRIALLAVCYFLADYIAVPLVMLEVVVAAYTAVVFGAIGMVTGKDQARANSILSNTNSSPVRVEKLNGELKSPSKPWETLQMYKGMKALSQSNMLTSPTHNTAIQRAPSPA